jgi:hypothetical protein
MFTTLVTFLGLIVLGYLFYQLLISTVKITLVSVMVSFFMVAFGTLLPFTYIKKHPLLWLLQIPLLLFYGLVIYYQGAEIIPYFILINALIFFVIFNVNRIKLA